MARQGWLTCMFLQQPNLACWKLLIWLQYPDTVSGCTYHVFQDLCHRCICISPFNQHGIFNVFTKFWFPLLKESLGPFCFGLSVEKSTIYNNLNIFLILQNQDLNKNKFFKKKNQSIYIPLTYLSTGTPPLNKNLTFSELSVKDFLLLVFISFLFKNSFWSSQYSFITLF